MFECIGFVPVFQLPLFFITLEIKQDQRKIEPQENMKLFTNSTGVQYSAGRLLIKFVII
jgi:hypothetical protein